MRSILLEAPILTRSGYGEHARLVFRALASVPNLVVCTNPLNWGSTGWISEFSEERVQIEESIKNYQMALSNAPEGSMPFDAQVFVGIPNEFTKRAPYSVCVTAGIETDRVSPAWLTQTHRGIDKIVVPSEHAKAGFTRTSYAMQNKSTQESTVLQCNCPVEVVPYPVKDLEVSDLDFNLTTKFNFLSVALLGTRKNLENMIVWFLQEFKDEDVGLVVKTGHTGGSIMDRTKTMKHLRSIIPEGDRKCKIYLLHGDLSEEEIHSLYVRNDIHAYVNLAHGEGYGLPIFEAAYSGMPIIAPDWSGHLDFLVASHEGEDNKKLFSKVDYDLRKIPDHATWKDIIEQDSYWAYPKESSFKFSLRSMFQDYEKYKTWAKSLKESLRETHQHEKVLKKMIAALEIEPEKPEVIDWMNMQQEVEVIE